MTNGNPSPNLRIAIVGGGIGGLTCAIALKNSKDVQLDLYEAASEISEIGAGITVWPRTWTLLRDLGLEETLIKGLKEPPRLDEPKVAFAFRKSDQPQGLPVYEMKMNGGSLNFYRKDIQQALLQQLPPFCKIHLNHRLVKCTETSKKVQLEFLDGNQTECDLLVGADGIKSVVRDCLKGQNGWPPVYSGSIAFRGLVPRERLVRTNPGHRTLECPTMYLGKNRHLVVYPIDQNRIINVVAYLSKLDSDEFGKPWSGPEMRQATTEEILRVYEGWESEVQELLQCIENPICWVIQDLNPLDSYVGRQTLLLGDAAHAMTPHLGAGAALAMEDAYILGAIISGTTCKLEDVPRILRTYDEIRRPFCNYMVSAARQQLTYYELTAPDFDEGGEGVGLIGFSERQISTLSGTISSHWSWASSSLDEVRKEAVALVSGA
ncbi:salicylate hydroxylase [Marasmius fiardii PR-910]|nr:salicylate hydroxylase [Marasmius fiardii PR-910]